MERDRFPTVFQRGQDSDVEKASLSTRDRISTSKMRPCRKCVHFDGDRISTQHREGLNYDKDNQPRLYHDYSDLSHVIVLT